MKDVLDMPVGGVAWAAVDFEGTGTAPGQSDEPVQIGLAMSGVGEVVPGNFFRSYVRPVGRLTRAASAVHRIRREDVENAPSLMSLWPEIKARLSGSVVVAHGAGTEKRFLRAFPMHGFGPWVDTLVLARAFLPGLPEHSLSAVARACEIEDALRGLCPGLDWHDALFDAVASLLLLREFIGHFNLSGHAVGGLVSPDAASYYRHRSLSHAAREAGFE